MDQPLLQISYVSFQTFYVSTKPYVADLRRMFRILELSYGTLISGLSVSYSFSSYLGALGVLLPYSSTYRPVVVFLLASRYLCNSLMGIVVHGNYQGWWRNVTSWLLLRLLRALEKCECEKNQNWTCVERVCCHMWVQTWIRNSLYLQSTIVLKTILVPATSWYRGTIS